VEKLFISNHFRQILRGPTFKSSKRLDGQTVVITGGNSGIGYETAKDLCRRGARVVMLCRDDNRARKAVALIQETLRKEGD
jgi:retinol dehydrogenase-12